MILLIAMFLKGILLLLYYREGVNIECVGHCSRYWSGDLYPYTNRFARGRLSGHTGGWYEHRYIGCSVRAVKDK